MPKDAYPTDQNLALFLRSTGLPALQDTANLSLLDFGQPDRCVHCGMGAANALGSVPRHHADAMVPSAGRKPGSGGVGYGGLGGLGGGSLGGSNLLFLDAGLRSVTSVATHLTDTDMAGTVQLEKRDFWLSPTSAPSAGMPYMAIKFRWPVYGDPQSIQVVGSWGRARRCRTTGGTPFCSTRPSSSCPRWRFSSMGAGKPDGSGRDGKVRENPGSAGSLLANLF